MTFFVSAPLEELMRVSNVKPGRLNAVIGRRLARGEDARMRPGDYYPALLRRQTGVPVVGISRVSNHLCLSVESRRPLWHYFEQSRNNCVLWVPATIAETLKLALIDKPARALALTASAIDDIPIANLDDDGHWTRVSLRPQWQRY